jgi:hypothetical protein
LRSLSNSRNLNKICVRLASEVSRHAGNAATAAYGYFPYFEM